MPLGVKLDVPDEGGLWHHRWRGQRQWWFVG